MGDYIMPEWPPEESWDDTTSDGPEWSNTSSPTIQRTKEDEENTQSIMDVPSDTDTSLDTKKEEAIRTESVEQLDSEVQDNKNKKKEATSTMDPDEIFEIGRGYMRELSEAKDTLNKAKFDPALLLGINETINRTTNFLEELERQQVVKEIFAKIYKYQFGKSILKKIGKKRRLIEYGRERYSIREEDILFGEQYCAIESNHWKDRYAINNGGLIRNGCPYCHEKTIILCFNWNKNEKQDPIIISRFCDCMEPSTEAKNITLTQDNIKEYLNVERNPTGIKVFDELTDGYWKENVLLLVGRAGCGKTRASFHIAFEILENTPANNAVLYLSYEMSIPSILKIINEVYGNQHGSINLSLEMEEMIVQDLLLRTRKTLH